MMKPLPDLDSVYSMLIHDEKQTELQASLSSCVSESTSFSVGAQRFPSKQSPQPNRYTQRVNFDPKRSYISNDGSNLFCKYCKKPGHLIGKCRKLYGNGYNDNTHYTKGKQGTFACVPHLQNSPPAVISPDVPSVSATSQPTESVHGFSKE
ncbi:hypothetical protein T459_01864 [Capsicum annuum]|uniref:CCHC-type domain-containing protein n=1 Tax=Capsicum annuum TaxID=4072 RepID=A0A2G3AIC3_CAPAN|nr:hypothetical protein T459_01864 [Capsicum annuum]